MARDEAGQLSISHIMMGLTYQQGIRLGMGKTGARDSR